MKTTKKVIGSFLCVGLVFSSVACTPHGTYVPPTGDSTTVEQIDTEKTQLYVYNFYGGYGSDWLASLKERFEEAHKDDVWEEGKKGVQIFIHNDKTQIMTFASQIPENRDEVYFTEYAYYYTLRSEGVMADITDALTEPLTEYGESESIVDKLSAEQQSFYGVKEGEKTTYYGLPHYSGYSGLIYNVDLFDEEGYYFAETPLGSSLEDQFVSKYNTNKSAGPDGKPGTSDDGLPATYEQFFQLCEFIASNKQTPVTWNGFDNTHYLTHLAAAFTADYEGLDQMMLNYTLGDQEDNVAADLATIQDGKLVMDSAPMEITEENGYELARQAGKYYALSFLHQLTTTDRYHNSLAFNTSFSHTNAQEDFLYAGNDGVTADAAILVDGCWWESEANAVFDTMVASKGDAYSKYNRNFAWMPLPKATSEKVTSAAEAKNSYTLYDEVSSLCFVKSNIEAWKLPLAKEFIRFAYTDASLSDFTAITNTPKAVDYEMRDEDLARMTPFGRSLMEIKNRADIVYPYSTNPTYVNNQSYFGVNDSFYSKLGTSTRQWPSTAFHDSKYTAEEYFSGMYVYFKESWETLI